MTHIVGDSVEEIKREAKARMARSVEDLSRAMGTIRTGRASLALLEPIRVDYYGTPTPLNQVATLSTPSPTSLSIQPWDVSQIGEIEKAIRASDLGINPINDGKVIRLNVPPLTQERRQELVKQVHKVVEDHRVSVRNIRRDANEAVRKLERDKAIPEDDGKRAHEELQHLTDSSIEELNKAGDVKEAEILELH